MGGISLEKAMLARVISRDIKHFSAKSLNWNVMWKDTANVWQILKTEIKLGSVFKQLWLSDVCSKTYQQCVWGQDCGEKKHENVNIQKIRPQIFLDVAIGRNKNSQLGYKAVIFDGFGQWGLPECHSGGGREHFNQYWEQLNPEHSYLGSFSLLCCPA